MSRSLYIAALVILATSCRTARPRRFTELAVVPAPLVALPPGQLNAAADETQINNALAARYGQAFLYQRHKNDAPLGLFCTECEQTRFLGVTALAAPAPPAAPEVQTSLYLRSAERAQSTVVKNLFARLPPSVSAADALTLLAKTLGDGEKPAKEPAPLRPRVELTLSHVLSLPGEWERVQYLAVLFVLHSKDVRFADTNEFENLMRDLDLGHLTQTAVSSISATGSMGFGNAPPGGASPGNVSVTPSVSYTEALDRNLKEQLQFRASSLDFEGRGYDVVLKSSQQNKLPTLVRQVVTLQYRDQTGSRRVLKTTYKAGELTGMQLTDQVFRNTTLLSASDRNDSDPSRFLTRATPVVVGVVRRVRNANGINTSLEDDDKVQYVAQTLVLDPITLDESPKCEYSIRGQDKTGTDVEVRTLAPGDPHGTPAIFLNQEDARRFIGTIIRRYTSATQATRTDGLLWDAATPDLTGYRLTWAPYGVTAAPDNNDWAALSLPALHSVMFCRGSAPAAPPKSSAAASPVTRSAAQ